MTDKQMIEYLEYTSKFIDWQHNVYNGGAQEVYTPVTNQPEEGERRRAPKRKINS